MLAFYPRAASRELVDANGAAAEEEGPIAIEILEQIFTAYQQDVPASGRVVLTY